MNKVLIFRVAVCGAGVAALALFGFVMTLSKPEPKCWYEPQRVTELTYDQFHYRKVEVGRETPLLCGLLVEPSVDVGRKVCWEMKREWCP